VKILFSLLCVFCFVSASAQLTYETLRVDYDSSWHFKNLKIIPIRKKAGGGNNNELNGVIPFSQAVKQGLVTVTERGSTSFENVHWLRINTHSDKSVYIAGGEIVAGGRQDRMIVRDTILSPSQKDQYVPVMCVEEGRWSEREKKFTYGQYADPHLRKVLDSTPNQVLIWQEIDRQLKAGAFKNNSLAYLSRGTDKKYVLAGEEYMQFFRNKFMHSDSTIVGFVAISGDKVIGSDIFATTDLFYHQLDPLLRGYVDEALQFGAPVTLKEQPIRKYVDSLLKDEKSQEEFVHGRGKIFRQSGRVIHVNTFIRGL
jgi:hypothetical protein